MTTPAPTGWRIHPGLFWLGGGVVIVAVASALVVIETRGRFSEAPAAPAAPQRPAGDFAAYERANAARNEGRVDRDVAAYDAYRAAHAEPLTSHPLPEAPKR